MKLVIKNGFFDLGDPVYMDEEKRERFIQEMKDISGELEIINVEEIVPPGPGGGDQHKWGPGDLVKLFHGMTLKELVTELNRTDMSVGMKMVKFVPEVTKWMKENGITQFPPTEELIERYIRERGLQ